MPRGVAGFSGAAARQARRLTGLTADQVGVQLGVTEQTVFRWERNRSRPTAEHLGALAQVLNVSPADLMPRRATRTPNLRDLRQFAGVSIAVLSEKTKISASAIVRFERGVASSMSEAVTDRLAEVYGLTSEEIENARQASLIARANSTRGKRLPQ